MIDCACGTTWLNIEKHKAHVIDRYVNYNEPVTDHKIDLDGPTAIKA